MAQTWIVRSALMFVCAALLLGCKAKQEEETSARFAQDPDEVARDLQGKDLHDFRGENVRGLKKGKPADYINGTVYARKVVESKVENKNIEGAKIYRRVYTETVYVEFKRAQFHGVVDDFDSAQLKCTELELYFEKLPGNVQRIDRIHAKGQVSFRSDRDHFLSDEDLEIDFTTHALLSDGKIRVMHVEPKRPLASSD